MKFEEGLHNFPMETALRTAKDKRIVIPELDLLAIYVAESCRALGGADFRKLFGESGGGGVGVGVSGESREGGAAFDVEKRGFLAEEGAKHGGFNEERLESWGNRRGAGRKYLNIRGDCSSRIFYFF